MRLNRDSGLRIGVALLAVIVAAAFFAPFIAKHGPTEQPYRTEALAGPSLKHWLGVDGAGRDAFTRMLYGARVTLGIALGATIIAIGGGVLLGAMAGTLCGAFDAIISHVVDFLLAFPSILL